MAKTTIAITVDTDVIDTLRMMQVNISKEVNDYLKTWILAQNTAKDGVDRRLMELQLEKHKKKLMHYQSQVKTIESKMDELDERAKQQEEASLKKQKDDYDAMWRCKHCGNMIGEGIKKHKFEIGYICNGCFLGATNDNIRRWSGR